MAGIDLHMMNGEITCYFPVLQYYCLDCNLIGIDLHRLYSKMPALLVLKSPISRQLPERNNEGLCNVLCEAAVCVWCNFRDLLREL